MSSHYASRFVSTHTLLVSIDLDASKFVSTSSLQHKAILSANKFVSKIVYEYELIQVCTYGKKTYNKNTNTNPTTTTIKKYSRNNQ